MMNKWLRKLEPSKGPTNPIRPAPWSLPAGLSTPPPSNTPSPSAVVWWHCRGADATAGPTIALLLPPPPRPRLLILGARGIPGIGPIPVPLSTIRRRQVPTHGAERRVRVPTHTRRGDGGRGGWRVSAHRTPSRPPRSPPSLADVFRWFPERLGCS